MSRFRRALAGAAMAVAMASCELLTAMAGAAPAHAATTPTPAPVSHTFSFTAAPAAQAGGGIGPVQCGDTCNGGGGGGGGNPPPSGPTTITCTLTVISPHLAGSTTNVLSHADVVCDGTMPRINLQQEVFYRGREVDFGGEIVAGTDYAHSNLYDACAAGGQWQSIANVYLTLPAGWVGTNPITGYSAISILTCP